MIIYWSMLLWVPFMYIIYTASHKNKEALADGSVGNDAKVNEKFSLLFSILVFGYFTFWIGIHIYI